MSKETDLLRRYLCRCEDIHCWAAKHLFTPNDAAEALPFDPHTELYQLRSQCLAADFPGATFADMRGWLDRVESAALCLFAVAHSGTITFARR
jgi:hypothetical protein